MFLGFWSLVSGFYYQTVSDAKTKNGKLETGNSIFVPALYETYILPGFPGAINNPV
jgi:hypothetical protein